MPDPEIHTVADLARGFLELTPGVTILDLTDGEPLTVVLFGQHRFEIVAEGNGVSASLFSAGDKDELVVAYGGSLAAAYGSVLKTLLDLAERSAAASFRAAKPRRGGLSHGCRHSSPAASSQR